MDSDYRENLLSYKRITDERCEPDSWAAITRNERFNRYSRAMHSGRLRCEKLALFLSKRITTNPPASADKQLLADQYRRVLHQFNEAFEQHRRVIASLFEPHGCEVTAISRYPLPKHLPPHNKYAALTYYHLDVQQPLCGAIHNRVSPEMLFYSTSTGDDFDERSRKLRRHQDIVRGILTETQPPLPPEDAVRERTLSVIAAVTYSVFVPACSVSDAFYTTGGSAAGAAAGAFVGSKASNNPAAPIIGAAIGGIARKPRRLSYYAKTNAEQINAQQKAYTEALLEQNGALKERIDALQKNESSIQSLQSEVERLKKELDSGKDPGQANRTGQPPRVILRSGAQRRIMSRTRSLTREKLSSFPVRKPTVRNFSSARCALNDKLARALGVLERRRLLNLASPFFPSRACLVFARRTIGAPSRRKTACPPSPPSFHSTIPPEKLEETVPISVHCLGKRAPGEKNFNRSPNNSEARRAWRVPEINRRMPVRMVATAASISARVEGAFS